MLVVILACNKNRVKVDSVEFLDIEEDIQGRDVITFKCPVCSANHKSYILG
jgi:hypothetical protein